MNERAMKKYIFMQDINFQIADRASFKMQDPPSDMNIYSAVPTLCIPNIKLGSNIRNHLNYSETNTVLNLGYSNNNFE